MTYGLTAEVTRCTPFLQLVETDYRNVRNAQRNVGVVFGIEEMVDAAVQNYVQFESELLSLSLKDVGFHVLWIGQTT